MNPNPFSWQSRMCLAALALAPGLTHAALVHRYSFDDLSDSVGSLDVTATGSTVVSGGSLVLDGGGRGELDATALGLNAFSALTLEFWATPSSAQTGFHSIFGAGNDNGSATNPPTEYLLVQSHRGDDTAKAAISLSTDGSPWGEEDGVAGTEFNDDAEHHYVMTVDATSINFYIDGVAAGPAATLGTNFAANTAGLSGLGTQFARIGSSYPGDPNWVGSLNEFRIHDNALSAGAVAASFAAGSSVVVPEPSVALLGGLGVLGLLRRRRSS